MLRTFAAALLATTLVAGTAFAAEPTVATGSAPAATATAPAAPTAKTVANATKPIKTVKHVRKHAHKRVAAHNTGKLSMARHLKTKTSHQGRVAHNVKPAKTIKGAKKAA